MKINQVSFGQTFINSTFQNLSQENKEKLGPSIAIGEYYGCKKQQRISCRNDKG